MFISDLTWITYLGSMISINNHICWVNLFHLKLSNRKTRSMKKFNCVTNFKCLAQARIDKKEVSAYDYLFFSPPRFFVLPLVYNISFGPAITSLGCVNTLFTILLRWAAIAYIVSFITSYSANIFYGRKVSRIPYRGSAIRHIIFLL